MSGASRTGDVVLGRFRIEASLGRGAAGYSFRGVDLETERPVVIKELPAEARDLIGRYQGEIAVLRELRGQFVDPTGIERVLCPLAAGAEHDQVYSVRPLVEGQSLRDRLRAGPVAEDEIRTILGDVARALGAAHRENLVLRNLKPENILVEAGGRARVAGVGTGCFLTRARREDLGIELGGLRYVAPEQLLDARRVDRRTDLFALGLILYEVLAGQSPVVGRTATEVVDFLAKPFRLALPPGPRELAELSLRLVHFHPGQRPPEAGPVLEELAPWLLEPAAEGCCEGCESVMARASAFCTACGRAVRGPCPHCGTPVPLEGAFCRGCGVRVGVAPMSRLVGLAGSFQGEVVSLPKEGEVRLGRAKHCEVSFEGRDQYVSRHQAALRLNRGRRWVLGGDWDTGRPTTNGTLLNGRNLDGQGPVLLLSGDRLRVGDSFFRYEERSL